MDLILHKRVLIYESYFQCDQSTKIRSGKIQHIPLNKICFQKNFLLSMPDFIH